jgi:hypothetical protein
MPSPQPAGPFDCAPGRVPALQYLDWQVRGK